MATAPDYLNPAVPADLPRHIVPVIDATPESLEGYGVMFDDPEEVPMPQSFLSTRATRRPRRAAS